MVASPVGAPPWSALAELGRLSSTFSSAVAMRRSVVRMTRMWPHLRVVDGFGTDPECSQRGLELLAERRAALHGAVLHELHDARPFARHPGLQMAPTTRQGAEGGAAFSRYGTVAWHPRFIGSWHAGQALREVLTNRSVRTDPGRSAAPPLRARKRARDAGAREVPARSVPPRSRIERPGRPPEASRQHLVWWPAACRSGIWRTRGARDAGPVQAQSSRGSPPSPAGGEGRAARGCVGDRRCVFARRQAAPPPRRRKGELIAPRWPGDGLASGQSLCSQPHALGVP